MKSEKNIVRDIFNAQGIWGVEPTDEAVKILRDYGQAKYTQGGDDESYDHQYNESWR